VKRLFPLCAAILGVVLFAGCSESVSTTPSPTGNRAGLDYRNSKADIVVLNFFDMYCIHCQRDAKHVNELYSRIKSKYGSKVAFYGVGWGNSPMEVEMYRKRYNVKYPLIPDEQKTISKRFGKVRTPLIIVLKKEGGHLKEEFRISKIKNKKDEFCLKIGGFCVPVTADALKKAGKKLSQ
jgi:peroxiredoxin